MLELEKCIWNVQGDILALVQYTLLYHLNVLELRRSIRHYGIGKENPFNLNS